MNEDYGLPKVELKPIERGKSGLATAAAAVTPKRPPLRTKKETANYYWPIILIALFALLIGGGAFYYFFLRSPEASTDQLTENTIPPDRLPLDTEEGTEALEDTDDAKTAAALAASVEKPGTITTISERTGRYYIFLGSYKFRAYAERHAAQLAKDGFAVKLVDQDNWVGLRVAVGNYGSEEEAKADAASLSSKYGIKAAISQY